MSLKLLPQKYLQGFDPYGQVARQVVLGPTGPPQAWKASAARGRLMRCILRIHKLQRSR